MKEFEGVANTLFIPLYARISISKEFPEYFYDKKALELEENLPQEVKKGSSQYSNMASVARYYNIDKMIETFFSNHESCNIVYLGCGLETAYDSLYQKFISKDVHWYEIDLPEVIEARRKILGERDKESLIGGDMFKMEWVKR